jgi:hypothetical protein
MKRAALCLAIAACQVDHHVDILLGPTPTQLSQGFLCVDDAGTPLIESTRTAQGYTFQLVIDVIDFGTVFPGCRGEELLDACTAHDCRLEAPPVPRFCLDIAIPAAHIKNSELVLQDLRDQLRGQTVLRDAPHTPVVIRATTTRQSCAALTTAVDGAYPALVPDLAVGCAYSCPAVLDDIDGPVLLSLDTLNNRCANIVKACASATFGH